MELHSSRTLVNILFVCITMRWQILALANW
jgi:hypothetical protein